MKNQKTKNLNVREMQPDFRLPDLVRDCTEEICDKVDRVIGEIKDSERRFGNVLQQIIQVDIPNYSS